MGLKSIENARAQAEQAAPQHASVVNLRIDADVDLPGEDKLNLAAEIWLPPSGAANAAFVCLPGGGMNRRFYNLEPDETDDSFSFAQQMAKRGFISVLIDHLGIGESDRPEDGYALTPEILTWANAGAARYIINGLRKGSLGTQAMPNLVSIGVGHSMGAMLTVLQQAGYHQHDALVLLGFGTRGLPDYLKPEARELAADPAKVRAELVRLARDFFSVPYPRITRGPRGGSTDLYGAGNVDPRGVEAIKAAIEPILPVPAFMSMLPGNVAPEAAQIDVPVFLGIGEKDLVGPPQDVPAAFSGSPAVTLHILPGAGHSHFLFPARTELFDKVAGWARTISKASEK